MKHITTFFLEGESPTLMLFCKNERSFKKENSFTEGFFSSKSKYIKKVVYKVVIQNWAIKCYHEFHLRSHEDLEILILTAPFLITTKVIL